MPSFVVMVRIMTTRIDASTMVLSRSLPTRSITVGTPSIGAMQTFDVKTSIEVVCEKRANTMPVASAVRITPTIDSAVTRTFAPVEVGYIAP